MTAAFVAGATGYTGRFVVEQLVAAGVHTFAHARPDSSRLDEWRKHFERVGATVDVTPWSPEAMRDTMSRVSPRWVFALLGTTRARAKVEGRDAASAYEAIDFGLTRMLIDAVVAAGSDATFVYLSSVGVTADATSPYLAARARVEAHLEACAVRALIARPSFITGADRDEWRRGERVVASMLDVGLRTAAWLGAGRLRDRFASLTGQQLATGLVHLALHDRIGVVDAAVIRHAKATSITPQDRSR